MRILGLALIAVVACACAPAPFVVASPEPCRCERRTHDDAVTAAPKEKAAAERATPMTDDEAIDNELVRHNVASQLAKVPRPECAALDPNVGPVVQDLERELIAAIREARAILFVDDPMPAEERAVVARAAYDEAIENFKDRVALRLRGVVFDAVVSAPTAHTNYDNALFEAFVYVVPPSTTVSAKPPPSFVARFRDAAIKHVASQLEQTATVCADRAVESRRGRWNAVFTGKL